MTCDQRDCCCSDQHDFYCCPWATDKEQHECANGHFTDHGACRPVLLGRVVGVLSGERIVNEAGRVFRLVNSDAGLAWQYVPVVRP